MRPFRPGLIPICPFPYPSIRCPLYTSIQSQYPHLSRSIHPSFLHPSVYEQPFCLCHSIHPSVPSVCGRPYGYLSFHLHVLAVCLIAGHAVYCAALCSDMQCRCNVPRPPGRRLVRMQFERCLGSVGAILGWLQRRAKCSLFLNNGQI